MDCSYQAPLPDSPGKNTGESAIPSSSGSSRPRDQTGIYCDFCVGM